MIHGEPQLGREPESTIPERLGAIQNYINLSSASLAEQARFLGYRCLLLSPQAAVEARQKHEQNIARTVMATSEILSQISYETHDHLHIQNPDDSTKWGKMHGLNYSMELSAYFAYVHLDASTEDEWKIVNAADQLFIGSPPLGYQGAFDSTGRQVDLRIALNSVVLNYESISRGPETNPIFNDGISGRW
jgi:hypothetical protein